MRDFAKTLAVMGVLTPAGVNALGVGEIKLHSALNQKLLAEIPILAAPGEDPAQIQVHLASPQAFAKAGLSRPYYLTRLRFSKPLRKPDGSLVVQVTSTDAIREPFLDFLVQVEWPQGKMLREFTVLLDPPLTYDDVVKVPQTPPGVTPAPIQRSRSSATVNTALSQGQAVAYGPVRRNESLWQIAEKLKPDAAITTEQMVMALYRKNPQAFEHDNVNELKAGVTLKVPEREEILSASPREARRAFQRHYQSWLARRAPEPEPRKEATADVKQPQLKLEAPKETESTKAEGVDIPVVEGPEPGADPAITEELAALKAENEALKARLDALETRLNALLEMKNAALAGVAAAGQTQPAPSHPAEVVTPEPAAAEAEKPVAPEPSAAVKKAAAKPEPAAQPPKPKPRTEPRPETKSRQVSTAHAEESGWGDPLYLSLGGGSLLLLGAAGWLIWRRRTLADAQADSLLVDMDMAPAPAVIHGEEKPAEAAADTAPEAATVTPAGGVEVAESSFLSEFTPSDFDILEADDEAVDPIAEADVYLAYGRYQQAEELIKQALAEDSANRALQLKLLEIYYANEDAAAFEKYARELQQAGAPQDPEFWSKVEEMARELEIGNKSFSGGGAAPAAVADAKVDKDEADPEPAVATFDLADSGEEFPSAAEDTPLSSEGEAEPSGIGETVAATEATTAADEDEELLQGLDFDLGDFDLEALQNQDRDDTARKPEQAAEEDDNVLAFSVSDEASSENPQTPAEAEEAAQEDEEHFDLTDMDELDTKLDLARAYVDMDDVESARAILEEVLSHGSEKQRQEAKELLERVGMVSS
ncbi:pilus assembly protein FimV [Methylomarinovum tepidoasis]|uniref:Pilus assembly protein FimV n=1 Tax=Methylomarinovum tepidoasis TaxID=2840183 RepID=A0AAU9CIM0_9GAMM|nr:FimV/HubP family polar landmark protein [Methylomarinovum sp. IN45]BCX89196.1 pilus assembly protein FimV [Methylomarinovum sp. IN45]